MPNYYLAKGAAKEGPYTFEQLLNMPVTPRTQVWHSQLPDWLYAEQLPELKQLFAKPKKPSLLCMMGNIMGHAKSPRTVLEWLAVYTVVVSPLLWVFSSFLSLAENITAGGSLFSITLSVAITVLLAVAGLKIRKNFTKGRRLMMIGFGLDIAGNLSGVLIHVIYHLAGYDRHSTGPSINSSLIRYYLLFLPSFAVEAAGLIWLILHPSLQTDFDSEKGDLWQKHKLRIVGTALVGCVIWFGGLCLSAPHVVRMTSGSNSLLNTDQQAAVGLTREQLALSSQTVSTHWVAWRSPTKGLIWDSDTPDTEYSCTGSSGVLGLEGGKLHLATNRHVLALLQLRHTKLIPPLAKPPSSPPAHHPGMASARTFSKPSPAPKPSTWPA